MGLLTASLIVLTRCRHDFASQLSMAPGNLDNSWIEDGTADRTHRDRPQPPPLFLASHLEYNHDIGGFVEGSSRCATFCCISQPTEAHFCVSTSHHYDANLALNEDILNRAGVSSILGYGTVHGTIGRYNACYSEEHRNHAE